MTPRVVSTPGPLLFLLATCFVPVAARSQAPASTAPAVFQPTARITGYLQPRFQTLADSAPFFLPRAPFPAEGQISPWASCRAPVDMRTIGAPPPPPSSPL